MFKQVGRQTLQRHFVHCTNGNKNTRFVQIVLTNRYQQNIANRCSRKSKRTRNV